MGGFRSDYLFVGITLPRYQKHWISKQKGVNFSGLVQEMVSEIIRQKDPSYFEMHAGITNYNIQRKDMVQNMIKNHPEIVPVKQVTI